MEKPIVFFIGKPGSGKDTQAKLLSEATGWPVVTTSSGLREIVSKGGAGSKLKETMDAGILTPYWMAAYVYLQTLLSLPSDGTIIFAGTSRTVPESHIVRDSLEWLGRPFYIFHLTVPDEEVHTRINLRKETENRKDDHVVGKRLEEYYSSTEAAINVLREHNMVTDIDGHRPIEIIAAEIRKIVNV
jgi:adenylate kinase